MGIVSEEYDSPTDANQKMKPRGRFSRLLPSLATPEAGETCTT